MTLYDTAMASIYFSSLLSSNCQRRASEWERESVVGAFATIALGSRFSIQIPIRLYCQSEFLSSSIQFNLLKPNGHFPLFRFDLCRTCDDDSIFVNMTKLLSLFWNDEPHKKRINCLTRAFIRLSMAVNRWFGCRPSFIATPIWYTFDSYRLGIISANYGDIIIKNE